MPGPPNPGGANPPAGQPVAQCKRVHWITIRLVKEPYHKKKPDWWTPPPPPPYPSEQFDAGITDGHKDAETDSGGGARYDDIPDGSCSVQFKSFYKDIERALHPHRFQDAESAGATAAPSGPISVDLKIQKKDLTLKHKHKTKLQVIVSPAGTPVDEYSIEIRRASGGPWCKLSANAVEDPWIARIAGKFELRGVAKIGGTEFVSANKELTVQFPTKQEIFADGAVTMAASAMWCDTLNDCTSSPNRRREHGMWILLNTTADDYEFKAVPPGPWCGPKDVGSVTFGPRPDDTPKTPSPCDPGATYFVAWFHTHTPVEFRAADYPPGTTRPTGPSDGDEDFSTYVDLPGVAYDYVDSPAGSKSVPLGHPKGSAARIYFTQNPKRNRRETPP